MTNDDPALPRAATLPDLRQARGGGAPPVLLHPLPQCPISGAGSRATYRVETEDGPDDGSEDPG